MKQVGSGLAFVVLAIFRGGGVVLGGGVFRG